MSQAEAMQVTANKVMRFEDLIAWQKARVLVAEVYRVTRGGAFARDFALVDQLRRAAVSVLSNIAEGFDRRRWAEFHNLLVVAKGSAAEVRSQLYVALDVGYLDEAEFRGLYDKAVEVARIVAGLRSAVQKRSTKA